MIDTKICFECGSDKNIHQHHVIPKSLGGTKTIPLCNDCHGMAHNKKTGIHKNPTEWRNLCRLGLERYVANGGKLGRQYGQIESIDKFMAKPQIKEITNLLQKGYSVRNIIETFKTISKTRPSSTTIMKVRKQLGIVGKQSIVNINSNKWI